MLLRKGGFLIKEGRRLVGNVKNSFYQVPGTGGGKEYNGEQKIHTSLLSQSILALFSADRQKRSCNNVKYTLWYGKD